MKKPPALQALEILGWIRSKRIKAITLDPTSPVLIILEGRHFYQKWLRTNKSQTVVSKHHKQVYLRKGMLLVPIWQNVPKWEIDYLISQKQSLTDAGILQFSGKYCRLAYMKVIDLDHAFRQPLHVFDTYFNKSKPFPKDFLERYFEILRIGRITLTIADRFRKIRAFRKRFHENLVSQFWRLHCCIDEIIGSDDDISIHTKERIIHQLREIIKFCQAIKWQPLYRRLYFASRSLDLAIKYIQEDNLPRATARMRSALKNLEYPKPS